MKGRIIPTGYGSGGHRPACHLRIERFHADPKEVALGWFDQADRSYSQTENIPFPSIGTARQYAAENGIEIQEVER